MWGIGKLDGRDLDVGFAKATVSQLYTGVAIIAIVSGYHDIPSLNVTTHANRISQPVFFFSSPISTVLWLIGASGVTILGHASFMEKDVAASFSEEAV